MSGGEISIVLCDTHDGCDEWTVDHYEMTTASVNGVPITLTRREALHLAGRMQRGTIGYPKSALGLFIHEARRIDATQALVFVNLVADRVRTGTGDPLVALDSKGSSYIRSQYGQNKSMQPALAMYCVSRAWNAWRDGEKLASILIRSDQSKIPTLK